MNRPTWTRSASKPAPAPTSPAAFAPGLIALGGALALALVAGCVQPSRPTPTPAPAVPTPEPARTAPAAVAPKARLPALAAIVASMPPGTWRRVDANAFSEAWVPESQRPLLGGGNPPPSRMVEAWSGAAWDSRRGQLILHGGGHADYRGNEVYLWRGETLRWERGSLPSEVVDDPRGGSYQPVDGADAAPASTHTYDNLVFLPRLDRLLVLGGAAEPGGGHYLRVRPDGSVQPTGPYLFDPSKADANAVGGTTGSHVRRAGPQPGVVGARMWSNRDSWARAAGGSTPPREAFVAGCSGLADEGGRDVVYVRTEVALHRFEVGVLDDPSSDRWSRAGVLWAGSHGQSACAVDARRRLFVSPYGRTPFVAWDLARAGPDNREVPVVPADPRGEFLPMLARSADDARPEAIRLGRCGLDHDPVRGAFQIWCGDARVWSLTPPAQFGADGWTIELQRRSSPPSSTSASDAAATASVPRARFMHGILGKWMYVPNVDAFVGMADAVHGEVWIWKPAPAAPAQR